MCWGSAAPREMFYGPLTSWHGSHGSPKPLGMLKQWWLHPHKEGSPRPLSPHEGQVTGTSQPHWVHPAGTPQKMGARGLPPAPTDQHLPAPVPPSRSRQENAPSDSEKGDERAVQGRFAETGPAPVRAPCVNAWPCAGQTRPLISELITRGSCRPLIFAQAPSSTSGPCSVPSPWPTRSFTLP